MRITHTLALTTLFLFLAGPLSPSGGGAWAQSADTSSLAPDVRIALRNFMERPGAGYFAVSRDGARFAEEICAPAEPCGESRALLALTRCLAVSGSPCSIFRRKQRDDILRGTPPIAKPTAQAATANPPSAPPPQAQARPPLPAQARTPRETQATRLRQGSAITPQQGRPAHRKLRSRRGAPRPHQQPRSNHRQRKPRLSRDRHAPRSPSDPKWAIWTPAPLGAARTRSNSVPGGPGCPRCVSGPRRTQGFFAVSDDGRAFGAVYCPAGRPCNVATSLRAIETCLARGAENCALHTAKAYTPPTLPTPPAAAAPKASNEAALAAAMARARAAQAQTAAIPPGSRRPAIALLQPELAERPQLELDRQLPAETLEALRLFREDARAGFFAVSRDGMEYGEVRCEDGAPCDASTALVAIDPMPAQGR